MQYANQRPPRFKVILLGESGVGKTSLFQRFRDKDIPTSGKSALTIDQCQYSRSFPAGADSRPVQLDLWDTANMERMHSLTGTYFRETAAVLLVYDINDAISLRRIPDWKSELQYHTKSAKVFLVGNKIDLQPATYDDRHTTVEHVNKVMEQNIEDIVRSFSVSAKDDKNVEKLFHHVAQEMWEKFLADKQSTTASSRSEAGSIREKDHHHNMGHGGGGLITLRKLPEGQPKKKKLKCCHKS